MGNPSQAFLILSREDETSAEADLYRGAVMLAMGRHEEGLRWVELASREVYLAERAGLLRGLGASLAKNPPGREIMERLFLAASENKAILPQLQVAYLKSIAQSTPTREVLERIVYLQEPESVELYLQAAQEAGELEPSLEKLGEKGFARGLETMIQAGTSLALRERLDLARKILDMLPKNHVKVGELMESIARLNGDDTELEAALRFRVKLEPASFEPARNLSVWLFSRDRPEDAEEVLFSALRNQANSLVTAREAARVLADRNRLNSLKAFVLKYRSEVGSPLVLSDALLHLLAKQQDWPPFFREMSMRVNLGDGFAVGNRLSDYVEARTLEGALNAYAELQPSPQPERCRLAVSTREEFESHFTPLLALELSARRDLASEALGRQMLDSVMQLLPESGEALSPEALNVRARAQGMKQHWMEVQRDLASLGTEDLTLHGLHRLALESSLKLGFFARESVTMARESQPQLLQKGGGSDPLAPLLWEALIYAGQTSQAELLLDNASLAPHKSRYLKILLYLVRNRVSDGWMALSREMTYHMDSEEYVNLEYLKILLMPFAPGLEAGDEQAVEQASGLLKAYLLAEAGRVEEFQEHWKEVKDRLPVSELLDVAMLDGLFALKTGFKKLLFKKDSEEFDMEATKWREMALKWFENFHQSFYTPQVVERLLDWHRVFGSPEQEQEFIRFCLMRQPSSLSAQILRNRLL